MTETQQQAYEDLLDVCEEFVNWVDAPSASPEEEWTTFVEMNSMFRAIVAKAHRANDEANYRARQAQARANRLEYVALFDVRSES